MRGVCSSGKSRTHRRGRRERREGAAEQYDGQILGPCGRAGWINPWYLSDSSSSSSSSALSASSAVSLFLCGEWSDEPFEKTKPVVSQAASCRTHNTAAAYQYMS